MSVPPSVKEAVEKLVSDSAMFIDRDELDLWVACFETDGRYVVLPREIRELGLPVGLMHCDSRARIQDRIVCLRHANKFNPHFDRHILSMCRISSLEGDVARAETNFMIVQSSKLGEARLFCAGVYEDRIRVAGERATFVERIAVLDSFAIPTMLATPV